MIEFCSENEVVLREATDGMRGEVNRQTTIAGEMEIRMMVLGFSDGGNALNHVDGVEKIFACQRLP